MITAQFGDLSAQKELFNDCTAKGLLNTTQKLMRWVDNLCLSLNHDHGYYQANRYSGHITGAAQ